MSASAETIDGVMREEETPVYVINLCASTTPVALVQPSSPQLKRYTFFVTRRREEGRERFRLHMGYFTSQAEADALLADVREVYPAAWSGPAPTHKPAPRAVAVKPVTATLASVAPAGVTAPVAAEAPPPAPSVTVSPQAQVEPAIVATSAEVPAPVPTAVRAAEVPAEVPAEIPAVEDPPMELSLVEDLPRNVQTKPLEGALEEMSNVREVLAALDDAPAPQPSNSATVPALNALQELTLLEAGPVVPDAADALIRMVTPEDTQTLRDINLDTQNKAPPCFAVQLIWSVTPIDMAALPQLAIFGAYTLYHVEGNRQGRRWYGVRLGFFSDTHAAKQVAYYMKADYSSVVVVPVTVKERARASGDLDASPSSVEQRKISTVQASRAPASRVAAVVDAKTAAAKAAGIEGFELIADDLAASSTAPTGTAATGSLPAIGPREVKPTPVSRAAAPPKAARTDAPAAAGAARAGKKPTGKRVVARTTARRAEPGQPAPLEETLEMLGASTLTLDDNKELINDLAVRRPVAKPKQKAGMRLSRLLGRLSEKLGDAGR